MRSEFMASSSSTPVPDAIIRVAASRFRAALDRVDPNIWTAVTIKHFPRGACGHAAELLGRYLRDELGVTAEYVLRDFYNDDGSWRGGHAWLEYDGLIIDITGDQFGWESVIVQRESAVHMAGELQLRQSLTSDIRWWASHAAPVYAAARGILGSGTAARAADS